MKKYQLWAICISLIVVAAITVGALLVYFGLIPDKLFVLAEGQNPHFTIEHVDANGRTCPEPEDPWWDTWEFLGVYKFQPGPEGINPGSAYFVCTGIDSFEYHNNGTVLTNVPFLDIYKDAERIGNVIPGIHDPKNGYQYWT